MNKKTKLAILGVIALVLVTLSLTYAYWLITRTQTKENIITAGCLDISLSNEKNDISLTEQFPISDDEGKELTPYTFTVTNNCNTAVDYNINLEALGDSSTSINASSLKVMVNDYEPTILGDNSEADATISDAYALYKLDFGTLAKNGSVEYKIRLWIDEDASNSEMNKTFSSKVSVTAGQGINNPLKEGSLAYDLVSQYGGKDAISYRSYKYTDRTSDAANVHSIPIDANVYFGTSYSFDEKTKTYTLTGNVTQATIKECREGTKACGKYLNTRSSGEPSKSIIEVTSYYNDRYSDNSKYHFITGKVRTYANGFSLTTNEYEDLINSAADDYGTSYYLRGNGENNYVQFGTYTKDTTLTVLDLSTYSENEIIISKDTPMYWRIVRINGDGTIRLIYDGVEKVDNSTAHVDVIGFSAYNDAASDSKYLGYTYEENGAQVDSTIKGLIDDWYEEQLKDKYEKYIADSVFCNDLSQVTSADGLKIYSTAYRDFNDSLPTLKCSRKQDRYTVSAEIGNGHLTNPVGLMNVDEAIMAGFAAKTGGETYLKDLGYAYGDQAYSFWLTSPIDESKVFSIWADALLYDTDIDDSYSNNIRPVINLKADVKFTGNGSYETPYVIITD